MIIASKSYINKLEQEVKLLIKWPLSIIMPTLKRKAPAKKPRLRKKPRKNQAIEPTITTLQVTIDELNLQIKSEINKEVAMSISEICNKIYNPKLYDKAENNLIHG